MPYLIFGFAVGTFVCGLIAKYYDKESAWIKPNYLFLLSGLIFLAFVYVGWPLLEGIFV
jgi:hypothetical protein